MNSKADSISKEVPDVPEPNREFDLFISYAWKGRDHWFGWRKINCIKRLKRALERHVHPEIKDGGKRRFRVCTDNDDFELDGTVEESVMSNIDSCDSLMVVCTDAAAESETVAFELKYFDESREDQKPLAAALTKTPNGAFPDLFPPKKMAANLSISPGDSAKAWLQQVETQSHKIVALVWDKPLKEVHDRFKHEQNERIKERRKFLFRLVAAFLVVIALIGAYAIHQKHQLERVEYRDSLLATIDKLQVELQRKVDATSQEFKQDSRPNLEPLFPLRDELNLAVSEFRANFDQKQISKITDMRIRRANGTLLQLQGNFKESLVLVTEADEESAEQSYIETIRVRASSYFGLKDWATSLEKYQKILAINLDDHAARQSKGICLARLGRKKESTQAFEENVEGLKKSLAAYPDQQIRNQLSLNLYNLAQARMAEFLYQEAIEDLDQAIVILESMLEQGEEVSKSFLANGYKLRGQANAAMNRLEAALTDYDVAVKICDGLFAENNTAENAKVICSALRGRASHQFQVGHHKASIVDFDRAVKIGREIPTSDLQKVILSNCLYARSMAFANVGNLDAANRDSIESATLLKNAMEGELKNELQSGLALLQSNSAMIALKSNQLTVAIERITEAKKIYAKLIEIDERKEFELNYANCLNLRGTMCLQANLADDADRDFETTIKLLDRMVTIDGRVDAVKLFTDSLLNRANSRSQRSDYLGAIEDETRSIDEFEKLTKHFGRPTYTAEHASALTQRAKSYYQQKKLELAINDYDRAIELYLPWIEKMRSPDLLRLMSECHHFRGAFYALTENLPKAIEDNDRALELREDLVNITGVNSDQQLYQQSRGLKAYYFQQLKQKGNTEGKQ